MVVDAGGCARDGITTDGIGVIGAGEEPSCGMAKPGGGMFGLSPYSTQQQGSAQ